MKNKLKQLRLISKVCFALAMALNLKSAMAEIAVAGSPARLATGLRDTRHADRLFATDVLAANEGQLFRLETATKLEAGRYRMYVPLQLTPSAHPACSDLTVNLNIAGVNRSVVAAGLGDEFRDIPVSFIISRPQTVQATVTWSAGEHGRHWRLKNIAKNAPKVPAGSGLNAKLDDGGDFMDDLDEADDGSIFKTSLADIKHRLVALYPVIEKLSSVGITQLRPDKVLYKPGEQGTVTVSLKNFAVGTSNINLQVSMHSGLGKTREILQKSILVSSKADNIEIPFIAEGKWGTEITAEITASGSSETWREYFSIAENFWEVGIGHAYPIFTQGERGQRMISSLPGELRSKYSNWLDLFFWAPCDWSKLTPPADIWWSGQTSYPQDDRNLKVLIKALQEQGIRVATYAKGNAAGPFGWETARKHPQWFGGGRFSGRFNVEILDHFNDPVWRAQRAEAEQEQDVGWFTLGVDLCQLPAVDYGIDELIRSVKYYGWDAVRYDGHYTVGFDEMSTRNMRHLKERLARELPEFRLGYNWGRAPEWCGGYTHELREAMAGGGMYMQEGIRHWSYTDASYRSWDHYLENELRIAKRIYAMGGSYHCILDLKGELSPAQRYYKLVNTLIAGGHPAYGTHSAVTGSPNWGAFMTRWAELIWHPNLKLVTEPEKIVQVDNDKLKWKSMLQECVVAPDRKLLVVHLLNPPTNDSIRDGQLPAPLGKPVTVTFTLKAGNECRSIWVARPESEPYGEQLKFTEANGKVTVKVPAMDHWAIVAAEIAGSFKVPPVPPPYTENPDLSKVPRNVTNTGSALDPNKRDDLLELLPSEGFERLLNRGSANIGPPLIADPESVLGTVQGRAKDKKTAHMGQWWIGHPVGRFDAYLRVKWTDDKEQHTPQRLDTKISVTYNPHKWQTATLVTPDYPNPPADAIVLKEKGSYHDYKIATLDAWWAGSFCFVSDAVTEKTGDNMLFQERIIFRKVQAFTDKMIVDHGHKLPQKPAELRPPDTENPARILVIAGMFWQKYLETAPFKFDLKYKLPQEYAEIYAYDTIIFANTDMSGVNQRRILAEFDKDGGRIVLLGGNHALQHTAYADSYITELLPFELLKQDAVNEFSNPALLGLKKNSPDAEAPAAFWYHDIKPRENAEVLAWAGDKPISLRLQTGKGSISAFIGTVMGSPVNNEKPFWETTFWRQHIDTLVRK